jgi:hypothetical protein
MKKKSQTRSQMNAIQACRIMDIHRSFFYYESKKDDAEVEEAIR